MKSRDPNTVRNDYQQSQLRYRSYQYNTRLDRFVLKLADQIYSKDRALCGLPVYRVLKQIAHKLFINQLQIVFLANFMHQHKWFVEADYIAQKSASIKNFVNFQDVRDERFLKLLIINILFASYSVKLYLNEPSEIRGIQYELNNMIPSFTQAYSLWSRKYVQQTIKINSKKLKQRFQSLMPTRYGSKDYNTLVQSILYISPPYNPNKSRKNKVRVSGEEIPEPIRLNEPVHAVYKQPEEDQSIISQRHEGQQQDQLQLSMSRGNSWREDLLRRQSGLMRQDSILFSHKE